MRDEFGRKAKRSSLPDVRLSVTGDSNVGKSAVTVRFLTRRFIGEYQKNVEQTYRGIINFGTDAIKYDLKDSSRWHDKSSLLNWSTCIAVIYSITDEASFATASSILHDIYSTVNLTAQYKKTVPCIGLIGNKKDLGHLRKVKEEDAKNLAKSYGVGFWEVSAADDYHSTYTPLNSLIVESFLNVNGKHLKLDATASSSCLEILTNGDIGEDDIRRKSEPSSTERKEIDFDGTLCNGVHGNNGLINPPANGVKRSKKPYKQQEVIKRYDMNYLLPPSECHVGDFENLNNIAIEVTTPTNEVIPIRRSRRSGSWTKADKRRVVRRKTTEQKAAISIVSMPKSRSYTDLKSLEKEHTNQKEGRIVESVSAMMLNTKELDDDRNIKTRLKESDALDSVFLKDVKTPSSSSLSRMSSLEGGKNYWNKVKKDRRKMLELPLEQVNDQNTPKIVEPEPTCNKRSVRRKISQIFRPKSLVEFT